MTASLQDGQTALINASISGHTEVVRLLLQSQADVNAHVKVMCLSISGLIIGNIQLLLYVIIYSSTKCNQYRGALFLHHSNYASFRNNYCVKQNFLFYIIVSCIFLVTFLMLHPYLNYNHFIGVSLTL